MLRVMQKVPATSLLESMMALLLIFISLAFGLKFYIQLLKADAIQQESLIELCLQDIRTTALEQGPSENQQFERPPFIIEQKWQKESAPYLYRLELTVLDAHKEELRIDKQWLYWPVD